MAAMSRCSPRSSLRRGPAKNCSGSMTSGSRSVLSCSSSFIGVPPAHGRVRVREQVSCHLENPRCPRQLRHCLRYVRRSLKKRARKGGSDCSFYTRVGWGGIVLASSRDRQGDGCCWHPHCSAREQGSPRERRW